MREIKYIVVHVTDSQPTATIEALLKFFKEQRGWDKPGYHYAVKANGEVVKLLSEKISSYGVYGHNENCINIVYIGGRDKNGKPCGNTLTKAQEAALFDKIVELTERYPNAEVKGHRDFEGVKKSCPNFDVKDWLKNYVPNLGESGLDHHEEEE